MCKIVYNNRKHVRLNYTVSYIYVDNNVIEPAGTLNH